jgi:tRNA uridine 5-carboxymethylaminomethyl modification enzyme
MVIDLVLGVQIKKAIGVKLTSVSTPPPAVILTTGTFRWYNLVGNKSMAAGRAGESAAVGLTETPE